MAIGKKISRLRFEAGLTQRELGEKIGVSKSTIGFYESDKHLPTPEHAKSLAEFFKMSVELLLNDDEQALKEVDAMLIEATKREQEELSAYLVALDSPAIKGTPKASLLALLKDQIEWMRKQLVDAGEKEKWYQKQIDNLTSNFPAGNDSGRIITMNPKLQNVG